MLFAGQVSAAVIEKIRFEGNRVTQDVVMLREMTVKPGDPVDQQKIKESVQNIMNLGLFERVNYRIEPGTNANSVVLVITVIERYYIIPLPTARLDGNNHVEYGGKLRWNNVWGMNHRLSWDLINKGPSAGTHQYTNNIEYVIPRPFSSRYELTMNLDDERKVDDDPVNGLQIQRSTNLGFDVLKWLGKEGVSKGLFVAGGVSYVTKKITWLGSPTGFEQRENAVKYATRAGFDAIEEHQFNRSGIFFQYKLEASGNTSSTANKPYVRQEIDFTHLFRFGQSPRSNFNYNIAIGSSNNDVLGDKAFSIGGNTNLRGYKTDAYRGNAMLRMNFEYLSPFSDSPYLRKVFFLDTGDVEERLADIQFSSLKTGVGVGIRWKVRRFVNLDIRVDLAYGIETGEYRFGLGTRNTF
jgi:outer membrane protein assembly factor BamA